MRHAASGFNLIEMSLVLLIVGLLSVGGLSVVQNHKQAADYAISEARLGLVKSSLLSFLAVNRYLPCPDKDGDGLEDRVNIRCAAASGKVPFKDLMLSRADVADAFLNDLHYVVNNEVLELNQFCDADSAQSYFCKPASGQPEAFQLGTPPTATKTANGLYGICNQALVSAQACQAENANQVQILALVVAHNRRGGACVNNELSGFREKENCDGDLFFASGVDSVAAAQAFDDRLVTLSTYELKRIILRIND